MRYQQYCVFWALNKYLDAIYAIKWWGRSGVQEKGEVVQEGGGSGAGEE